MRCHFHICIPIFLAWLVATTRSSPLSVALCGDIIHSIISLSSDPSNRIFGFAPGASHIFSSFVALQHTFLPQFGPTINAVETLRDYNGPVSTLSTAVIDNVPKSSSEFMERSRVLWDQGRSYVEAYINSNPDLKLSASEFATKNIISRFPKLPPDALSDFKLQPLLENSKILLNQCTSFVENYINSHPDLKLSTSEFTTKNIISRLPELPSISTRATQPQGSLIHGNLLSDLSLRFQAMLKQYPSLQEPTSKFVVDTTSSGVKQVFSAANDKLNEAYISNPELKKSSSEYVSGLVSQVGVSVDQNFDRFLAHNPGLKRSTSEFVADYLSQEVNPKVQGVCSVVSEGPLGKGFRSLAGESTSAFTGRVTSSLSSGIAAVGNSPSLEPLASPFVHFYSGAVEYKERLLDGSADVVRMVVESDTWRRGTAQAQRLLGDLQNPATRAQLQVTVESAANSLLEDTKNYSNDFIMKNTDI